VIPVRINSAAGRTIIQKAGNKPLLMKDGLKVDGVTYTKNDARQEQRETGRIDNLRAVLKKHLHH